MKKKRTATVRTGKSTKTAKPKTPRDYLSTVSKDKRAALEKLRKTIKAVIPKAEECIAYGLPGFRLNGKFLVAYGAAANHCAFYPGSVTQDFKADLKNYDTSKGTIRFPPDKPLPAGLVRKLVKGCVSKRAK
jgi:uncharacterized protein YdhG (YjbR/CyaY superfamily)